MNRIERAKEGIETTYKSIKLERLRNLNLIPANSNIKTSGRIPPVDSLLQEISTCSDWEELRKTGALLKELRFLGSPKRTSISTNFLTKTSQIYSTTLHENKEKILCEFLDEMMKYDQLNPLIIPEIVPEDLNESIKTVLYTSQSILLLNE